MYIWLFEKINRNKHKGVRKQDIFYQTDNKSNTDDSFFNLKYLEREKLTANA